MWTCYLHSVPSSVLRRGTFSHSAHGYDFNAEVSEQINNWILFSVIALRISLILCSYLEIRKAQIKTAQEKVHNTKNPLTLVLTSSSLPGSKHSIVVKFLNILVIHMPTHTKASFLLHSWFLKKLVLFKPRMQTPICKIHKAPMDKSLYTFISTR